MTFEKEFLNEINTQLDIILQKILEYEERYKSRIEKVHPNYRESAKN